MRGLGLLLLLLAFWAALSGSGQLHHLWLIGAGVVTALVVVVVVARNDLEIRDWGIASLLGIATYLPWLGWQVVIANWRVIKLVWSPPGQMAIDPRLVEVPCDLSTATGRVLFANSITLTPGTVTVAMAEDQLLVHALTPEDADGVLDGSMQGRVKRLEPKA